MNIVDQTVALFSPRAALRREIARQKLTAFSRFDAAKITRARPQARRNMPAEQIGGTTERIQLMNRARDLDDNFSTVRAILTHFVIHTAGSLAYQARTGDTGLDQQVEAYLREWFRNCDITGRHSLQNLTQLIFRSVLVDGDCGVLVTRQGGELKLQTVTADRIGKDTDLDSLDPFYFGGITIDGVGRPVSYRVFSRDKFGTYRDPEDINADMFCHVANFTRPDEYRGRSALAAILDDAQDVSDLIEYEKLAARWASSQAGVIKTEYGADEEMASVLRGDRDQFGNDTKLTALEPGRVNYLNTGESMEMFKSGDRPAAAFANFVQYLENRMCRAMGTSARVMLDRPSAGPEARKDLRQAERTFDFWRGQMETQMLNKVVRLALLDAAARGILPSNPEVVRGEWQWPGSVSIDAGRDARADIELWRMGLATAAELYGEAGHDWQASMRQRAKEAAYIRELSVEMGVSPAEISGGVESVATDPNRAPVETPVPAVQPTRELQINLSPEKYAHIDFKPSEALAKEAALGLEWRAEYNRGGTEVGVARARDLSNRTNLSPETVRRMNSFLARHEVDKQGEGFSPGEDGYPSAGRIAWALWGGDAGQSWARTRVAQMDAADDKEDLAEVGPRGGIKSSPKAPKSDTPNPDPKGEGTAEGDASGKRGAEVTAEQEATLQAKADEFNEKESNTKNGRATLGALKSVFQRGLGAFNTSHSPRVQSAEQWAFARVNAFLYLLKNGRPENPNYTTDYDLLPEDHPKAAK
jgi:capsid protein